eukprot:TRINITY_DN4952_c0_g2_i1.p2 TRINITY_DN4952_c0_g2~~TRINITY_DN4952_c0_g2_i1.p2  ORF type:complete len:182 (+),score=66.81 TRINITY_DN4952_c0_g2_i1:42-587(+)
MGAVIRALLVVLLVGVAEGDVVRKNAEPAGKYCTTFDVLFLKETIELYVFHVSGRFSFKAKGAMTIPPCDHNKYIKSDPDDDGNIIARPDMNEPEACLLHELRHLGPEGMENPPVEILWQKETDTVDVRITAVPIIGEISFSLTKDACEGAKKKTVPKEEPKKEEKEEPKEDAEPEKDEEL